jgi:fatty acid desaturase
MPKQPATVDVPRVPAQASALARAHAAASGGDGGKGGEGNGGGSDFTPLLRQIRDRGLLERRRGYYTWSVLSNLTLLTVVWAAVLVVGDSWWTLLLAVPAAVLAARTGFLGHDAGHAQIARTRRSNRLLGLLHGNLLLGMSYGWWTDKHNRHHANPNHVEKDPDVWAGALVWSEGQAGDRRGRVGRWLARHQAALFFPMVLLEGIHLKTQSYQALRERGPRTRVVEAVLLVAHLAGYLALVFAAMSPGKAVVFIAINQALLGLHLGCAFAPNHKGMPMPGPGERWGHLRRQVLTSRNVRGGALTDWFLGGLNYQVEHHLFPSMPRPHLRAAQPIVRAYCERIGLPYTETGLIASYREALRHLHDVADPLRVEDEPGRAAA